jgi:hypothetical protein
MGDSSPVGIILACVGGALFVALLGGFTYHYVKGKRGMQALPGYTYVTTKVRSTTAIKAPIEKFLYIFNLNFDL